MRYFMIRTVNVFIFSYIYFLGGAKYFTVYLLKQCCLKYGMLFNQSLVRKDKNNNLTKLFKINILQVANEGSYEICDILNKYFQLKY